MFATNYSKPIPFQAFVGLCKSYFRALEITLTVYDLLDLLDDWTALYTRFSPSDKLQGFKVAIKSVDWLFESKTYPKLNDIWDILYNYKTVKQVLHLWIKFNVSYWPTSCPRKASLAQSLPGRWQKFNEKYKSFII